MNKIQRHFFGIFVVAGALAVAPGARADDAAVAQQLFDDAKKLMADGKWPLACPKLEESLRLSNAVGTKFNLADCDEHLGKTASAWANFLGVAAQTKAAGQKEREKAARERAAALEPKLSRLAIVVPPPRVPGLAVSRDGELVGEAQFGEAVPVDPGEHKIVASAPGKRAYKASIEVGGAANSAKITLPALDDEPSAPPAPTPTPAPIPTPTATSGSGSSTLGWVLVGTGAAALAGGVVMWVLRGNETSKLDAACGADGKSCPPGAADDIANGKTYSALGIGLFALSAVSAGAGVAVLLVGRKNEGGRSGYVTVAPAGRGVAVSGAF